VHSIQLGRFGEIRALLQRSRPADRCSRHRRDRGATELHDPRSPGAEGRLRTQAVRGNSRRRLPVHARQTGTTVLGVPWRRRTRLPAEVDVTEARNLRLELSRIDFLPEVLCGEPVRSFRPDGDSLEALALA